MNRAVLLSLGLLCALVLTTSTQVFATGTPAGTVITNTATLNYKDLAGNVFPAINASASITVAQVAGVAVTPPTNAQTVGDSVYVYYGYKVTNTGNGTDKYALTNNSTQNWTPLIYQDLDSNGVLSAAELALGPVTMTDSIKEDSSQYFIGRIFVPEGTVSGTIDSLTETASSNFTPATTASGTYVTTISAAVVPLTKTASNPTPQPGQTETYVIKYHNTGTAPALSAVISDTVNANYTIGTINNGGTASGNVITWNIGRIAGGDSGNVSFLATVKIGVPSGTVISNVANISFIDSTNGHHGGPPSPPVDVTVSERAGLTATISPTPQTQDVGLQAKYQITVHNLGNYTDSVSFAALSSLPLGWAFYTDANRDGLVNGPDSLMNFAKAGVLLQDSTDYFTAIDTIPHATADRSRDTLGITFTSLAHTDSTASATGILIIRAPLLTLSKSVVVSNGNLQPIPGDTLIYTIVYHDTGTGAASALVVTDSIPSATAYVANSVTLDGAGTSDSSLDSDGVTVAGTLITVNIGPVASNGSRTITFRAVVR